MNKKVIFLLIIFLIGVAAGFFYLYFTYPTSSPLTTVGYYIYKLRHPKIMMTKETLAFAPYWRLDYAKYARFDLLTEINYFSLYPDEDGNFIKVVANETDPGWLGWNSRIVKDLIAKTQISGAKFTLTVATQKNKTIESLLSSDQNQNKLIKNILDQVNSRHLDGIIIDFEYDGKVDPKYQTAFTGFITSMSEALHRQKRETTLSLTLMPLSARQKNGLFNLAALAEKADRIIGMSYDYYSQTSEIAGPGAPISGFSENKFFFDVETTYQDYLKVIPKDKIIMGIPYYGIDWAVQDGKKIMSPTLSPDNPDSFAAVISYARMRENKDFKPDQCFWDDYAMQPWCWYTDSKNIDHQVWFEDNRSIETKYDFAKGNDFGGIAIWTLGYDSDYPDLWKIMEKTFKQ